MSDYIFLFDMDSTITRKEVLPEVAKKINRIEEMRRLTEVSIPLSEVHAIRYRSPHNPLKKSIFF